MTNKKQVRGLDFYSTPNQLYKKKLVDLGESKVWVREAPVKDMLDYIEAGNKLDERRANKEVITPSEVLDITSRLILVVICDDQGVVIGNESNLEDIKQMPNSVINKIMSATMELSGVNIALALKAQEVAANLKNEGID
jgi:hypothetical protein